MATTTPNLGLSKPESADKLLDSLAGFNGNADLLDVIIGKLSDLNTAQKDSLVAAINEALTSAGTAAGFGDPVATVDGNTGTPSVEVTASGPDTAKVFTFTFKNLKGAQGERGDTGSTGPQGPKGDTGDTGPSGAGMDITGATVGQIARITAVDGSGKPTAWEAVDMPSGGGAESDPTVPNWAKVNMTGTVGQFISVSAVDDGGNVTTIAPVTIPNAEGASF